MAFLGVFRSILAISIFAVVSVLEVFSISLVGTFFGSVLAANNDSGFISLEFGPINEKLAFETFAFATASLFLLTGFMRLSVNYFNATQSWAFQKHISRRILAAHLRRSYLNAIQINASELKRAVLTDSVQIGTGIFLNVFQLISQVTLTILIVGYLLLYNPTIAAISFSLVVVVYGTLAVIARRLSVRLGKTRTEEDANRIEIVDNVVFNLKQLKIYWRERFFSICSL